MICLCCNKPIKNTNSEQATKLGWHDSCVKKFFRVDEVPAFDISVTDIKEMAKKNILVGGTVQGVQKKISLGLSEGEHKKITIVDYPIGFILKPQVEEYSYLPEYEHLTMQMAEIVGIKTVPNALIYFDGRLAYITRRIDRYDEQGNHTRLAMEDFCQLEERLTEDKYKSSYERCVKIIKKYSNRTGFDLTEILLRIIFAFITGNSDMHLKNFSLIQDSQNSFEYHLSPAYDLLPVNLIMPEDLEELALTLNGKKRNLNIRDFNVLASACGIQENVVIKMIRKIASRKSELFRMCDNSFLPDEQKEKYKNLIEERLKRIIEIEN